MSFDAIRWALAQPVAKSSSKFVLVAMADCVNSDGDAMVCWPSLQHLSEVTGQDRKTVAECVKRLREEGFIVDTGERRGATGQVVAYQLTAPEFLPAPRITSHYVYRLTHPETGFFYIGVRTCSGLPEHDTGYTGSGRWCVTQRINGVRLDKAILTTHADRGEAEEAERQAIYVAIGDPLCRNELVHRPLNEPKTGGVTTNPDFITKEPGIAAERTRISAPSNPNSPPVSKKEPVTRTKKEVGEPIGITTLEGIPDDLLRDYLAVRKAKRAGPLTSTALAGIKREATKAKVSLEDALRACCEFGWQGFNAGWYQNRMRSGAAASSTNKHAAAAAGVFDSPQDRQEVIDV